jgi:hypothetical protein
LPNEVAGGIGKENVRVQYNPQLWSLKFALLRLDCHKRNVLPNAGFKSSSRR